MYVFMDVANDQAFARRTETSRKGAVRDSLAVCVVAVTGLVVSLVMAVVCPEALEMTPELFLLL
jgi:hypothetical protein